MSYGALGGSYDLEDSSSYHKSVQSEVNSAKNTVSWRNGIAGALIIGVSVSSVFLYASSGSSGHSKSIFESEKETTETYSTSTITTTVSNEYTPLGQKMFPYSFLDGAVLMEPWRDNYVSIDGIDSSCSNTWKLTGKGQIADQEFSGQISSDATFTAVPKETGFYNLKVTSQCGKGVVNRWKQDVVVKYVRRELSTLTDADREEFLDALRTLWDVDTLTGQKKYGEKYKSLYYFATIHNDGGANPICDEFHRNTGFINNHVYLGAFLEQSLQLVNPRTALHYWEYTRDFSSSELDAHVSNQLDGGAWTPIMTAKFFGKSDPVTGQIIDSRWAHTAMPRMDKDFFVHHGIDETRTFFPSEEQQWITFNPAHVSSPYGFLRGPWNFSPTNETLRFNNAMGIRSGEGMNSLTFKPYAGSTCSDYKTFIEDFVYGQPLYSYLINADAQIHGYVHYTTGGAGGEYAIAVDNKLRSEYGFTDDDIATISVASARFFKNWISMGTLPMPTGSVNRVVCENAAPWDPVAHKLSTEAGPGEKGGPLCALNETFYESEEVEDTLLKAFFVDYEHEEFIHVRELLGNFTFEQKTGAMRLMFGRMQIDGDMAGSGSATDPLFWVAHGAVERLFQRTMFEDVLTDKTYKTSGELGSECQGHNPGKNLLWLEGFEFEDKSVKSHEITNRELNSFLDPTGEKYGLLVPFIYDSKDFLFCDGFDTWWDGVKDDPEPGVFVDAMAEVRAAKEAAQLAKALAKEEALLAKETGKSE